VWEAEAEIETAAPPDAVWELWDDPTRWTEWNEQLASVRMAGPLALGGKARIRFKRSPLPLTFTITALEPGRLFTDETRLPGARLGHQHLVESAGPRTQIHNRLYFDGPAERLWAFLAGRRMRSSVRAFVERERELAEASRIESGSLSQR
jgi:ligand-binding SRPBCC domain-containing protein